MLENKLKRVNNGTIFFFLVSADAAAATAAFPNWTPLIIILCPEDLSRSGLGLISTDFALSDGWKNLSLFISRPGHGFHLDHIERRKIVARFAVRFFFVEFELAVGFDLCNIPSEKKFDLWVLSIVC